MLQTYKNFTSIVSVIMATYNRAAYLPRSIESLLKQTYKDWELIVVDDGSSDDTFGLVSGYQKEQSNIRYLRQTNQGPALARNVGIMLSLGKYVTFLDSDDEYKPEHLENRTHFMEFHPEIDFIHGGFEVVGNPYVKDMNDLSKRIHLSKCHWEGSFFCKRNIFEHVAGFNNLRYAEGPELVERVKKIYTVEKPSLPLSVIYYRDTPGSISNTV